MRGNLSDQDLTDYALNELQPEVRLYMESMLAVSEECRHDIYEMIELRQMLEEGFEAESAPFCILTDEQRDSVSAFRPTTPIWQRAAALVGIAACAASTLTHPAFWRTDDPAGKVAQVAMQMSKIVADAVTPEKINFVTPLATIAAFAEESSGWLPAAVEPADPTICTPPSSAESGPMVSFE
ncbi:MAG: putative transrane anti-sigma factor [Chthoniobacteraceae bacterium]|nr:putative transrane anti-sigma factor [Chthoniobacteraceae bacterium]